MNDATPRRSTLPAVPEPARPVSETADARPAGRSRRPWRKYVSAFRVSLATQLVYPGEVWLRTIFLILIMFVFSSLWHTTYGETGRRTLGGLTLAQMLWYLAITEALLTSRPRATFRIDEEVRTGDLAYSLVRPYNFVLYRFAQVMGERVVRLAINLAVASSMALVFAGGVALSPAGLLPGTLAVLLAMSLDFLLVVCVQLLAFWVEDVASFQFVYDRLLMILGGVLLPIGLFPGPVAVVARALPFSAMINGPAQTLVSFDAHAYAGLLARQGAGLAVGLVAASLIFRAGVRRIHANGG